MKKVLLSLVISGILTQLLLAKESPLCGIPYDNVERKSSIINEKKNDLSDMAIKKLYSDLVNDVRDCISYCESKKFDLCNNVAKEIEKK